MRYLFFINHLCGPNGEKNEEGEKEKGDAHCFELEVALNLNENTEINLNFGKM